MAEYLADYTYTIKGNSPQNVRSICYTNLFNSVMREGVIIESLDINMYEKSGVDQHSLVFNKEDIEYVFNKLSHVIDSPIIEENYTDNYGNHIKLTFKLEGKTHAHIKTICTICRYFYEKQVGVIKGYIDIMKSSIEYSKLNPDIPFIEILQLMHYDVDSGGGHSIVSVGNNCKLVEITSDKTFLKNMMNKSKIKIYSYGGDSNASLAIFNHKPLVRMKELEEEYLKTINEIPRI